MTSNMFTKPVKSASRRLQDNIPVQVVKRNSRYTGQVGVVSNWNQRGRKYRVAFMVAPAPFSSANLRYAAPIPQEREHEYFYRSELKRIEEES